MKFLKRNNRVADQSVDVTKLFSKPQRGDEDATHHQHHQLDVSCRTTSTESSSDYDSSISSQDFLTSSSLVDDGTLSKSILKVSTQSESLACPHCCREGRGGDIKKVSWDTVEFRSHNVVLGDNPSATQGPPVSLGWKTVRTDVLDLDLYELVRPLRRASLLLSRADREERLREEGFSRKEMFGAEYQVHRIQQSRKASAAAAVGEGSCPRRPVSLLRRFLVGR
jgi:hypothetical protein